MNEQLRKTIDFPGTDYSNKLLGEVIAYKKEISSFAREYQDEIERIEGGGESSLIVNEFIQRENESDEFITWKVILTKPGPDARHLPGTEELQPKEFFSMFEAIKLAHKKMNSISSMNFDGDYEKKMAYLSVFPMLKVVCKNGEVKLEIWLASSGKYMYAVKYSLEEVSELIETLESCFSLAKKLTDDLEVLSD